MKIKNLISIFIILLSISAVSIRAQIQTGSSASTTSASGENGQQPSYYDPNNNDISSQINEAPGYPSLNLVKGDKLTKEQKQAMNDGNRATSFSDLESRLSTIGSDSYAALVQDQIEIVQYKYPISKVDEYANALAGSSRDSYAAVSKIPEIMPIVTEDWNMLVQDVININLSPGCISQIALDLAEYENDVLMIRTADFHWKKCLAYSQEATPVFQTINSVGMINDPNGLLFCQILLANFIASQESMISQRNFFAPKESLEIKQFELILNRINANNVEALLQANFCLFEYINLIIEQRKDTGSSEEIAALDNVNNFITSMDVNNAADLLKAQLLMIKYEKTIHHAKEVNKATTSASTTLSTNGSDATQSVSN